MTDQPTTDLTFLFTDIEGSTSLWEQHPKAMGQALARHDSLLRAEIERQDGAVFKTIGDAFCAVFSSPLGALQAAVKAQQRLLAETWATIGALRVRMAIHTGPAEQREGDYFGPTLNRVARLLGVAHGGQTLLSGPAQERLRNQLPAEIAVRDLGQHLLRNLILPEHIYQVVAPGLPSDFLPLVTRSATRHNLPVALTSFIGREQTMATAVQELTTTHLLSLIGPGGTGKTRLALQVAEQVLGQFPDGVWFVDLATISDPALIVQALAAAVQIRESRDRPLVEALQSYFEPKQALIILDNCEHLIDGAAAFATTLLRHCPRIRMLATSREALTIAGETILQVPALELPTREQLQDLEAVRATEAVRLLLDRVQAVQQQFVLTAENAAAVAAICQRLDGIPLALELVAARFKVLSVEQIVARLNDRFKLLTGGNRVALPRQQTLRALIDWSYDLLNSQEQTLLRRLVVFAGGWDLEAAELVVADDQLPESDVLDILTSLVQKSLVVMDVHHGTARYRMLETIRQYGAERMAEVGETNHFLCCHAEWCLQLATEADVKLRTAEHLAWLKRLEQEHDNMRAALEWSLRQPELPDLAARLATALAWFWQIRGDLSEGRRWLQAALDRPGLSPLVQASALTRAGLLAEYQGNLDQALPQLEQSVALLQQLDCPWELAFAQISLGRTHHELYHEEPARETLEAGLALFRELNDPWAIGMSLTVYGIFLRDHQKLVEAQTALEEALALGRSVGDISMMSWMIATLSYILELRDLLHTALPLFQEGVELARLSGNKQPQGHFLNYMGEYARLAGDYERAEELYAQSLAIFREMNIPHLVGLIMLNQGQLARLRGRPQQAQDLLKRSLQISYEGNHKRFVCSALDALAGLAVSQGRYGEAVSLFGALESLMEEFEVYLDRADRALHDQALAEAREHCEAAAWNSAWEAGQRISYDEIVAYALATDLASAPDGA